jgi:hypothetical protein
VPERGTCPSLVMWWLVLESVVGEIASLPCSSKVSGIATILSLLMILGYPLITVIIGQASVSTG